jgi:hypothetical protein
MANKADVDNAYWKGWDEGRGSAASDILRRLTAINAPQELRAIAIEVAQPDYYGCFDDKGDHIRDDIEKVKADRQSAVENHDKAVQALYDARTQLREAAMLASWLAATESDDPPKRILEHIRSRITDPSTARDNYGQMADRLYDETEPAIDQLLYSYSGRRLNAEIHGDSGDETGK